MRKVLLGCLLAAAACGSKSTSETPDANTTPDATPPDPNGCTLHLQPAATPDDTTTAVQTAFVAAKSGDVLCFDSGTYSFTDELSVTGNGITIKGLSGAVWDFSGQATGENGIHAMNVMDFVIEGLTIHDAPMNSVRIDNGTHVVMRDLTVTWTGGPNQSNGAYALYPVTCTGVLIEGCDVSNSSDAAVYVGQSSDIMVRNNVVHSAAAGIEIENSTGAEVANNWSFDNPAGILVFALPGLPVKVTNQVLVHDNFVEENNLKSFAAPGNVVAYVPSGVGMIIMAAGQVEVTHNTIESNVSTGIVVNSCDTLSELATLGGGSYDCTDTTPFTGFPSKVNVHDNLFIDNGLNPVPPMTLFELPKSAPVPPLADILWDGAMVNSTDTPGDYLCLMNNGAAAYENGDALDYLTAWNPTTDATPVTCTDTAVPPVDLSWASALTE
jgi:parallel beta-helix repeat protein